MKNLPANLTHFNPRAPCGARPAPKSQEEVHACISIHAPHAGRDRPEGGQDHPGAISIHAPHAGRDSGVPPMRAYAPHFNPRAPCGARLQATMGGAEAGTFQSTRPMRGATDRFSASISNWRYFNPRAPCGARLVSEDTAAHGVEFQSTRPMRGATNKSNDVSAARTISIHAPHAGRDPILE